MKKMMIKILRMVMETWRRITGKVPALPAEPDGAERISPAGREDSPETADKAVGGCPSAKEQVGLRPGVYTNPKGVHRIAIVGVGRRVVMSWDNESVPTVRLTTCSARAFTGPRMRLIRVFTRDEVASLMSKATPLRARRCSNRHQKNIFFGPDRLPGLPDFRRRKPGLSELNFGATTPETVSPVTTAEAQRAYVPAIQLPEMMPVGL